MIVGSLVCTGRGAKELRGLTKDESRASTPVRGEEDDEGEYVAAMDDGLDARAVLEKSCALGRGGTGGGIRR